MYDQINTFMMDKLSPPLTGFRKNHSTQNSLVVMLENWKRALDQNKKVGVPVIFMDLSKAFDTLNHKLLLAKLAAYGFSRNAIKLMGSYFTGRSQKANINNHFSQLLNVSSGVPQGSILGPLLYNIYLNDIFLSTTRTFLNNYADDNTLYAIHKDLDVMKMHLRNDFEILSKWFREYFMVLNMKKCHYMCLGNNNENQPFQYGSFSIPFRTNETILGITFDKKLDFNLHIKTLCKKAAQKINAFNRISYFINQNKRKILVNTFVKGEVHPKIIF